MVNVHWIVRYQPERLHEFVHLINDRDVRGNTVLHVAARWKPDLVESLILHGAHRFVANHSGVLPLHIAARYNPQIIHLLYTSGTTVMEFATAESKDILLALGEEEGPIHEEKEKDICWAIDMAPDEIQDYPLKPEALVVACRKGDLNIVKELVNRGADPYAKLNDRYPLDHATDFALIRWMLSQGYPHTKRLPQAHTMFSPKLTFRKYLANQLNNTLSKQNYVWSQVYQELAAVRQDATGKCQT